MISIIVPVYNVKKYLGLCIGSVKRQTNRDWECIVVDDGSTDGSSEILHDIADGDPRFKVILQENRGLPGARNTGLDHASGDILFFLDSDDWLEPTALDTLMTYSDIYPDVGRIIGLDFVHHERDGWTTVWTIDHPGTHRPDSPYLFTEGCDIGHVTACLYVRKNIPCEIRYPDVPLFEDMIFNMGLMFAGMETHITKCVVYHYIVRGGSLIHGYITDEQADSIRNALADLAEKYNPKPELYARFRSFLDNAIEGRLERNK